MEERNSSTQTLIREIREQSQAEAKAIVEKAEQEKAKVLAEARAEAEKLRAEAVRKAQAQAEAMQRRVLSGVHLEVKKQALQAREDAIGRIFGLLREKLEAHRKSREYGPFLKQLILEGVLALDAPSLDLTAGEAEKPLCTRTFLDGVVEEAAKRGKTVKLNLSKDVLADGGVVLVSGDGRTRFDNSFNARLRRHEDVLRMTAAKALS